jgi:hypothetical protein
MRASRRGWQRGRWPLVAALSMMALAACGSSDDGGASAVTPTTKPKVTTEATAPRSDRGGSFEEYFPHALGTTWVYQLSGTLTDRITEKVTAEDPQSGGDRAVTLSYHSDAHPNFDHQLIYVFRADGRLSILPQTIAFADGRKLPVGYSAVTYPSLEDLRAGKSASGTIEQPVRGEPSNTISIPWTVQGGGSARVTVPDGTFATVVVRETLGQDAEVASTYYAKGVGGVKSETEGSTTELISFTPGTG